jgi:hypothetical protein
VSQPVQELTHFPFDCGTVKLYGQKNVPWLQLLQSSARRHLSPQQVPPQFDALHPTFPSNASAVLASEPVSPVMTSMAPSPLLPSAASEPVSRVESVPSVPVLQAVIASAPKSPAPRTRT